MSKKKMPKSKPKTSSTANNAKLIESVLQKLEQIENPNFETAKILAEYSFFDLSKKIILENLRGDYDEVEFISAVSTYLYKNNINLIEENQIETHKIIIKETKQFYRQIRKSLKKIQSNFDETYLLYSKEEDVFYALENIKLVEALEELSLIMNLTNKPKEAEMAFDLKSKIDLGFQRYFVHEKETVLLSEFSRTGFYKIAAPVDVMRIYEYFKTDIDVKVDFKINNFTDILAQLNYLKKINKTEFEKEMKGFACVLEFFPEEIYTKEEYRYKSRISLSINRDFSQNVMQLMKEKLIIVNPYNAESYNLTLKLLK